MIGVGFEAGERVGVRILQQSVALSPDRRKHGQKTDAWRRVATSVRRCEHRDEGWLQSALYPLLDALGSRNLIEGRRKSAVQGRMLEVSLGAGTPFAFRLMVCLPVVASTSVLQTVSALSFLMVRLLWICERLRRSYGSVGTAAHLVCDEEVSAKAQVAPKHSCLGRIVSTLVGSAARNGSSDPAAALCCNLQPQLRLTPASSDDV
jgi:hypothetical protein